VALARLLLWNLLLSRSLRNPIPADELSWSSDIEKARRLVCLRELGPSLAYGSSGWDWAPTVTVISKADRGRTPGKGSLIHL
jgi:hypothetical protein